jgi:MFS family permease
MRDVRFLVGGACMLAIAMGVGRFAYTPLLPLMERDAGLTVSAAGLLAFGNLLGYLVGASIAMHPGTHARRLTIARFAVVSVIVMTAAMATTSILWLPMRFLTGVSSGFVLIFASSIVLDRAARAGKPAWPPLFFSGVGLGIAFSGIAVPAFAAVGGSRAAWLGIAAVSAAVFAFTARWFRDDLPSVAVFAAASIANDAGRIGTFRWLLAIYTAEAFAYVIPATFLVAIVTRIPALASYAALAWVFVGLAGACATFSWIRFAARFGKARALALALATQAVGIAAPVVSTNALAVVVAAGTLGGTFIAITLFAAGLGRDLYPANTSLAVSRLTVFYGVGQMIGPLVATELALRFGTYGPALSCAAAVAAIAAVVSFSVVRDVARADVPNVVATSGAP